MNLKGRRKRVLLQFFGVAVLLTTVGLIFGQDILALRKKAGAPELLGDLQLLGSYERSDAPKQIDKLLGKDIEILQAYTAVYLKDNKHVIIWVGMAKSKDGAEELTKRVSEGVKDECFGFKSIERLSVAGREVFRICDSGREYFFYNSRKQSQRIVWVTIDVTGAPLILEEVVKNF